MGITPKITPLLACVLLQAVLAALVGSFAVGLTINKFPAFEFALAALAADVLSLVISSWALIRAVWKPDYPLSKFLNQKKGLCALIVSPLIAYVVTMVFLLMMQFQVETPRGGKSLLGPAVQKLLDATWALFGASVVASMVVLIFCRLDKPVVLGQPDPEMRYTLARLSPSWSPSSPLSLSGSELLVSPPSPGNRSKTESSISSELYESYNLAPHSGVRSVSSRTRLNQASSVAGSETAIDSSPGLGISEATPLSSPMSLLSPTPEKQQARPRRLSDKRLASIPGSASNSPEKPIGWPFTEREMSIRGRSSVKAPKNPGFTLTRPGTETDVATTPRANRPRNLSPITTSSSTRLDESHIHPLFRSDSPRPPPTPSPATSVLASALGGKYVTQSDLARIRSISNPFAAASIPLSTFGNGSGSIKPAKNENSPGVETIPVVKSKSFQDLTSENKI